MFDTLMKYVSLRGVRVKKLFLYFWLMLPVVLSFLIEIEVNLRDI